MCWPAFHKSQSNHQQKVWYRLCCYMLYVTTAKLNDGFLTNPLSVARYQLEFELRSEQTEEKVGSWVIKRKHYGQFCCMQQSLHWRWLQDQEREKSSEIKRSTKDKSAHYPYHIFKNSSLLIQNWLKKREKSIRTKNSRGNQLVAIAESQISAPTFRCGLFTLDYSNDNSEMKEANFNEVQTFISGNAMWNHSLSHH